MAQRAPKRETAPAEVLSSLSLGYNGYTSPDLTKPQMWKATANVFSSAAGFIQRCRFCNVVSNALTTAYTSLKYFSLPGSGAWLLADANGQLFSYDTANSYASTQRLNPWVDPSGAGSSQLNGPWSREVLQNIVYEMNGTVKQSGRGTNAATIEGFGLDAPDASPQVVISSGTTQNITAISRSNGVVSATVAGALTVPGGNAIGLVNVTGVGDTSFNGTFVLQTGSGTVNLTWNQSGQNVTPAATGSVNVSITKTVGRSYSWAWENANKPHVSAPSPATQYILYATQNGVIQLIEPGTVSTNNVSSVVTGVGTAFTSAWVGRSLWVAGAGVVGRIASVQSATSLNLVLAASATVATQVFQVYDPQSTHLRLYETADGGATYFRVQRNAFVSSATTLVASGLQFFDNGNSEPPNFPFTTEISQVYNLPPPIGQFMSEYQGRLLIFGVAGALQSFFYSNQETTSIGMAQESYAPLNQVTLPIQNAQISGILEFPGSSVVWSDRQDMFRITGLLTDNTVSTATAFQQGATIARLPYALGCANPFACAITPLGGIWVTANHEIWLFTDRYAPRNIGRPVQDILNTISVTSNIRLVYHHTNTRNWVAVSIGANGSAYNNMVLILDLDLLAANGSPSYFTFDMATNHPSWWIFQPGPVSGTPSAIAPRCDSVESVYEKGGLVRLMVGSVGLIQDIDYQNGTGTEIAVPGANVLTHAWGNDSAFIIKRPSWVRFNTNRDPAVLANDGWTFQVQGVDDDYYTFFTPFVLTLTPGVNDSSALGGNPNLLGGSPFRHSPELFKIGGVNFVMGRRLLFQANFPSAAGATYQLRNIQFGFGPSPPR